MSNHSPRKAESYAAALACCEDGTRWRADSREPVEVPFEYDASLPAIYVPPTVLPDDGRLTPCSSASMAWPRRSPVPCR